jgi:hypothetical protein
MILLRRVVPRIWRGVKSTGTGLSLLVEGWGVPGDTMCFGVKYGSPGTPTLRSADGAIV